MSRNNPNKNPGKKIYFVFCFSRILKIRIKKYGNPDKNREIKTKKGIEIRVFGLDFFYRIPICPFLINESFWIVLISC
jgi:hypothetical protein